MHSKHHIDQDGFKDELVRLDWLSVMNHLCQLFKHLVATISCCLVKTRCEKCVQDPNTVEAIIAEVCLRDIYILGA